MEYEKRFKEQIIALRNELAERDTDRVIEQETKRQKLEAARGYCGALRNLGLSDQELYRILYGTEPVYSVSTPPATPPSPGTETSNEFFREHPLADDHYQRQAFYVPQVDDVQRVKKVIVADFIQTQRRSTIDFIMN